MDKPTQNRRRAMRSETGPRKEWKVVGNHVCPVNDLREHLLTDCWCSPMDDDGIIVHNSLDQRELYERGDRKAS
jgi:hypothetical protein